MFRSAGTGRRKLPSSPVRTWLSMRPPKAFSSVSAASSICGLGSRLTDRFWSATGLPSLSTSVPVIENAVLVRSGSLSVVNAALSAAEPTYTIVLEASAGVATTADPATTSNALSAAAVTPRHRQTSFLCSPPYR